MTTRIERWLAKHAYIFALTLDPRLDPSWAESEVDYIWAQAVDALVSEDLRIGFRDGDDIVLRYRGNKADWERLRAMVQRAKERPPGPSPDGSQGRQP